MAVSTHLYRFKIELADIPRSVYETLDFRVAQHPSESLDYLLTRVLAYALNYQEGLNFSAEGLHNPDEPCLRIPSSFGGDSLWIEIGNPSARKLHKASKASKKVKVYTYKNPKLLLEDMQNNNVHRSEEIEIYALSAEFLEQLSDVVTRESQWMVTYNDGSLVVVSGDKTINGELQKIN
jgi:uncharacterized protein YaeQ